MDSPQDPRRRHDGGFDESGVSVEELAWGVPAPPRTYWPARASVLVAMSLYLVLPDLLIPYPRWIVPTLEGSVLIVLSIVVPHRTTDDHPARRVLAIVLIGIVSAANTLSLGLLIHELLAGRAQLGRELIFSSIAIWLTNVIAFGLWYWELDRGGPFERHSRAHREPDFLFPQMATPGAGRPTWAPSFMDYMYVSLTNATAFSPTDTMPLTLWAKSLMTVQSLASLLTVAVVAARAVNILS
ncbi:MAG: hypothetical protein ACREN2_01735 [Candidatus Dormibacteria bacterium]